MQAVQGGRLELRLRAEERLKQVTPYVWPFADGDLADPAEPLQVLTLYGGDEQGSPDRVRISGGAAAGSTSRIAAAASLPSKEPPMRER